MHIKFTVNKFSLILISVLFFSSVADAKKYYASSASEITAALSNVQPGDTVIMRNGTWTDQHIVFQKNGTAENNIYLIAETPGEVILNGTSTLRIAGNYLVADGLYFKDGYSSSGAVVEFRNGSSLLSNYCRLTNTAIVNYNPSDKTKDYKWISLYGTHNRVDHCYLKGKDHIGTTLVVWLPSMSDYQNNYAPNYHLIDSNYFAYRPVYPENGAETIRIGDSSTSMEDSYTTVEYNYFEECNGETEIVSNKSCENIYRYNTFKNCQGILTLRHGNRCTVEGNFFFCGYKPNSGGIRVIGEDHKVFNNYIAESYGTSLKSAITIMNGVPNSPLNRYFQVKRAIVAFNTVVNSKVTLNIGAGKDSELSLPPQDCIIANNVFYSSFAPLVTFTDQPENITWAGNIFFGTSIGMTLPQGNINSNPLLLKDSENIYRIQQGSPAVNASDTSYDYISTDMDGQNRVDAADIGADELSTAPVAIGPMSAENTGPAFIRTPTSVIGNDDTLPSEYLLGQNYPNPFNPTTKIKYSIPAVETLHATSLHTIIKIYDMLGKEIATLVNGIKSPGNYEVTFDGSRLSSGVYFYIINAGNYSDIKKMILIK